MKNNRPMLITFLCCFDRFNGFFFISFSLRVRSPNASVRVITSHRVCASDFFCFVWHISGVAIIHSLFRLFLSLSCFTIVVYCIAEQPEMSFTLIVKFIWQVWAFCSTLNTQNQTCLMLLCCSVENRVKWNEIHEFTWLLFFFFFFFGIFFPCALIIFVSHSHMRVNASQITRKKNKPKNPNWWEIPVTLL